MKFLAPKLVIATAIALVAGLATAQQAEFQNPGDFVAAHNGGHHGHHHHYHGHHGHYRKPHHKWPHHKGPKPEICNQIDLVCKGAVIDSIACRPPKAIASPDGTPYYEKTKMCNKANCKKIASVTYVKLNGPCSPKPSECAAALGNEYPPTETDTGEIITEEEDEDDNDDDDDEPEAEESNVDIADDSFEGRNNGGRRHHHKNHGHHHHKKGGRQHHKQKPHHYKSKKHPWAGLCTSTGPVCGSELFGCDYIPSALYN
ncbi:hypothetical protein BGZ97_008110, partial [Linnemannia gamsii]